MRRLRTCKSLVLIGLAVVVFVAIVPTIASGIPEAILTPLWLVVPAIAVIVVRRRAARSDERPVALLSLVLFRAPPVPVAL